MTREAVQIERADCDRENDRPILSELGHALERLLLLGEETTIDITSLPVGTLDEKRLAESLGTGEVEARLLALGESLVAETAFPGVWWIEHRNEQGEVTSRALQVTFIPEILKSQREDVADAAQRIRTLLGRIDQAEQRPLDT
jgi:hydrogenase-1 operon protein HyaF